MLKRRLIFLVSHYESQFQYPFFRSLIRTNTLKFGSRHLHGNQVSSSKSTCKSTSESVSESRKGEAHKNATGEAQKGEAHKNAKGEAREKAKVDAGKNLKGEGSN